MTRLPPENVNDYPRPPRLERTALTLRVTLGDSIVAETSRGWRVLETHHAPTYYLPPDDIAPGVLRPAGGRSLCEWKGYAGYHDLVVAETRLARVAWSYPAPTPPFSAIAGHVAFYCRAGLACSVGGVAAVPQPGDFYGGWVTPNLRGIVKGGPGTRHW